MEKTPPFSLLKIRDCYTSVYVSCRDACFLDLRQLGNKLLPKSNLLIVSIRLDLSYCLSVATSSYVNEFAALSKKAFVLSSDMYRYFLLTELLKIPSHDNKRLSIC